MKASVHLRGIVIAGVLAAVALALGFVTLAMNQSTSQAAPHTIVPLKLRHHAPAVRKAAAAATTKTKPKAKAKPKPKPDKNLVAALHAGLPRSVARALAARPVAVVELTSGSDTVAGLAAGEAKAGASDGGASYVAVNVDNNGGDVEVLTRLLGHLPVAPATLVYVRPAQLVTTLPNFNDRTVIQQAVESATPTVVTAGNTHWATQANAICAAANADGKAMKGAKVDYAAQSAAAHTTVARLTALKPPAGEATSLQVANATFAQAMALLDQVRVDAVAKKSPVGDFVNAMTLMSKAFITYNRLGATVCTTAS